MADVVIVGGGPAGAALGYLLASRGAEVAVLERETDFDRVFRGEGLMPSGVDAIYQMGLGRMLTQLPFRKLESWDMYIDAREIFSVPEPYEELGDRAMRIIPQAQFLDGIMAECREFPNFRLHMNASVRDLVHKDGRVAGVIAKVGDAEQEIPARLVIGCDGRGSLIRTKTGQPLRKVPEQYDVLWFKIPAPERLSENCRMLLMVTAKNAGACYTSWDGFLRFALMIPKGGTASGKDGWREGLTNVSPPWLAEHIESQLDAIDPPVKLNVLVGRCKSWTVPGVLLIGDAAHPMSPIRAQGINVALRDAIVAANHIVPALHQCETDTELDEAVREVQREREPEIVRAQTLQYRDARGLFTRAAPLLIGMAGFLGPKIGKYRWAQNAWLNQQHDLRFGSTEVELRV